VEAVSVQVFSLTGENRKLGTIVQEIVNDRGQLGLDMDPPHLSNRERVVDENLDVAVVRFEQKEVAIAEVWYLDWYNTVDDS